MSRVLVTGGAGTLGAAIVRRLLGDPDFEVRVADQRPAPDWMREGCEVHAGDLRDHERAREAIQGCSHVIHLAAIAGDEPFTVAEANHALHNAAFRAAVEHGTERFAYVSSAAVFERAERFPTPEEHLPDCPPPRGAFGWSKLTGEHYCRAAHAEHDLPYTICRPFGAYAPGEGALGELVAGALRGTRPLPIFAPAEHTRTLTHVGDIADGIVTAMAHPAGLGEDFNLSAPEELTMAEIARMCWEAAGNDPAELELEPVPGSGADVARRWPAVEKAERLLGWSARTGPREGIAQTAARLRDQQGVTHT